MSDFDHQPPTQPAIQIDPAIRGGGLVEEGSVKHINVVPKRSGLTYMGFDVEEIAFAFNWVQCPHHWRGPIDTYIPSHKRRLVAVAIIYHLRVRPEFSQVGSSTLRVRAAGYQAPETG